MREPRVGRQWSMAPLGYRVSAVARDRLLLVGDAAGYLSPITGQGNEFALRTGRLAATAADNALRAGDLSAGAFASYIEGRKYEVERQVDYVRAQLRILRDRDASLRASRDDEYSSVGLRPLRHCGRRARSDAGVRPASLIRCPFPAEGRAPARALSEN